MAASSHPALRHLTPPGPPPVRIEVRNGNSRPIVFDVSGEDFLIGSVPGCDLRLPGTNLPPVVCLIARQADGVRLRKLAPTLPVLVNGQPVGHSSATNLIHGDCISVGAIDIIVSVDFAVGSAPTFPKESTKESPDVHVDILRRERELLDRERQLEEQTRELEADRIIWYRRREEIERETQQAQVHAATVYPTADAPPAWENRLQSREEELDRRAAEIQRQQDELLRLREETLAGQRNLNDRFSEQRGQLEEVQDTIRESLERIRQREAGLDAEFANRRQLLEDELRTRRQQAEEELRSWREQGDANVAAVRAQIESELREEFRQRSEELDRFQLSLREAAVQLRESKQQLDDEIQQFEPRREELAQQEAALNQKAEELEHRLANIDSERSAQGVELRAREEQLRQREHELNELIVELRRQQTELEAGRELVDKGKKTYENDLIRLDRWQATLDEKEKQLAERAQLIDQRFERFRTDGSDLEEQVLQIDAREEQMRAEEERLARQRATIDEREAVVNRRVAQLEGQQAMLAALRTRLEHIREEQRVEAARIADERGRLDDMQSESRERLQEAERLREQLALEHMGQSEAERLFRDRSELLQQAVARVRDLQQQIGSEDERLRLASNELLAKEAEIAEREGLLQAKTDQLLEAQRRVEADRVALKQREESIFLTEGTRESLQDQLRRRAEELMNRQRELDARAADMAQQAQQLAEQQTAIDELRNATVQGGAQVETHAAELARRDEELRQQSERLKQAEQALADQRKQLEDAQTAWRLEREQAEARENQARLEIDELKQTMARQASELFRQVPDMESRAQGALDRTTQARESLRSQLAELHSYAKQSQDDLDKVRAQVQDEVERLRQQETALNRSRTEHRHAVASFRQQLVEWQGRFSGMKQALSQGESRIERREKDIESTSQQLARQAEELDAKEREVVERRDEMHRHLNDMREWYRKKLRELVASRNAERGVVSAELEEGPDILPMPGAYSPSSEFPVPSSEPTDPNRPVILSIQDELDPADRKLGELLQTLELVDADTMIALWSEARRQHRPLRQVLLAGSYLTLYQLALIESGNLSGLVLGRFRIVDRLQSTAREAIYRAFDPSFGARFQASSLQPGAANLELGTCLLRHLGEIEMNDAVRPDEYRQRFGAARDLAHPNVAATLEILDINGRPAVVQEWLNGLSGSDFPAAAGSPGVWYRLLSQAALGLHTAHQAGLIHGRLTADSLVLTRDGVLKITGLGEPPWLHANGRHGEPSAEDDLRALGQIVLGWSQLAPKRKGKKGTPDALLGLLGGLGAETGDAIPSAFFPSVTALLEEIDRISSEVPGDGAAWQKLLEHVAENASDVPLLRQSA